MSELEDYKNYWLNFQTNFKKIQEITGQIEYFKKTYGSDIEETQ
jgi:hypothetical protein